MTDSAPALFEFAAGSTPLLISFPHSGTHLPEALRARMTETAGLVADTDWYVPELYAFARAIGAGTLIASHSRYVVDLNRPPDGARLYPGKHETGVCPIDTFAGMPIYQDGYQPDAMEITRRIERYWRPYHERLQQAIDAIRSRHGRCIVWDAHSIRSRVPAFFDGRLPDLNVGTADGASCSTPRAAQIERHLTERARFSFVMNGRFKGGYITRRYGVPAQDVDAVQMEIAQCAYMSEERIAPFDPAVAQALQAELRALLELMI
jgi:N-formylglutamate deformylase